MKFVLRKLTDKQWPFRVQLDLNHKRMVSAQSSIAEVTSKIKCRYIIIRFHDQMDQWMPTTKVIKTWDPRKGFEAAHSAVLKSMYILPCNPVLR